MDIFDLENDFEFDLTSLISKNYNTKKSFIYMVLRYLIVNFDKESYEKGIDIREFVSFLKEENNLPNELLYQGEEITNEFIDRIINNLFLDLNKSIYSGQSLLVDDGVSYVDNIINSLKLKSIKKNTKYKGTSIYRDSLILSMLEELNIMYKTKINLDNKMKDLNYIGFKKKESREDILRTKISNFLSKNIFISESELEEFLKKDLSIIEDGLTYISSQFPIKDGLIDILARDKDGNSVIIELKVKDDERLIWQSLYYPKQYKKEHINENIRMITLCPSYPSYIKDVLDDFSSVEKLSYNINFDLDGKIESIIIYEA